MSLQDLKTSTQALTMEEWAEFLGWCVAEERPRREMLQAQEEARTRLIMHLRATSRAISSSMRATSTRACIHI